MPDEPQSISRELLEILACPVCKTRLTLTSSSLTCESCSRVYPIRNGIPILLEQEATRADK